MVLGYVLSTFALGVLWHFVIFKSQYDKLQVFREDVSFPLGLFTIILQGCVLAYLYRRLYQGGPPLREGLRFGLLIGLIFWSTQGVAAAAKHPMGSVVHFLALETGFFLLMFSVVGPVIAFLHGGQPAGVKRSQ